MNKSSNKHMNVFQAYTQKKDRPIENNVSRGFAIVLQESPSLFMLFLQKLNEELKTKNAPEIPFPQGEYTVDFQRKADSFHEEVNTLIGVTLTANELEPLDKKSAEARVKDCITDISISFDDVLLFIEVKRTDENCGQQVKDQLDQYLREAVRSEKETIGYHICGLTWTNVVELLRKNDRGFDGFTSRLEKDYLEFLILNYPTWAPVDHLHLLRETDDERINLRLNRIKQEYVDLLKNNKEGVLVSSRQSIPLDFSFASECNVHYCHDYLQKDGKYVPCVTIGFWAADTCTQFWRFRDSCKKSFFNSRRRSITVKNQPVELCFRPYVKFSHWQRGVLWLDMDQWENDRIPIDEWISFAVENTGKKWKKPEATNDRDAWNNLAERISANRTFFSTENSKRFNEEFYRLFAGKSYATVSFGIEVTAVLSFAEAQKIDRSSDSGFAVFLQEYIKKIKIEIEK